MRDNPYFGLLYVLVPFSLVSVGGGPAIGRVKAKRAPPSGRFSAQM